MSFLPVSAALRLEFEGLLESQPRVGTRVRIPTIEDVTGHYVVREALESQAARLFGGSCDRRRKAELQKLAVRVMRWPASPISTALHEELHAGLPIARIVNRCPTLSKKRMRWRQTWRCVARPASLHHPRRTHQDVVAALCGGDPELASAAMRNHVSIQP
jgi:DNA-binding GntR family transcriptional regulator